MSGASHLTVPPAKFKVYAPSGALGADVDLVAEGGGPCRGISIGVAGDLILKPSDNSSNVTLPSTALAIGIQHAIVASKIIASGTTAQKIVVWW